MVVATPAATANFFLPLAFPDAPSYFPVPPSIVSFSRGKPRVVVRVVASSSPKPKGEPRGITKPLRVSEELQSLVGVPEIPRPHALKRIWAYIKDNNLRVLFYTHPPRSFGDPNNKKIIICDEKLKKIFGGKDRVGFLEIAGLISPHLLR